MNKELENIDKVFVTNGGLKFEKDNTKQELLLNDDGIMDLYCEGKLVKSTPFSKLALMRECKTLTQEGYKIYINDSDFIFDKPKEIKEVETEEEAKKEVDKLTKKGHEVSYEKVDDELTEAELASKNQEVEKDNTEIDSDNIDTKATKEEIEQQIEDVKEIQDLKQELEDEVDKLNEAVNVYDYGNIVCSYGELEDIYMPKLIEELKKVFPDYDWDYGIEWNGNEGHPNIYDKDENFNFVEQDEDVDKINKIIRKIFKSDEVYIEPIIPCKAQIAEVLIETDGDELDEAKKVKETFPSTEFTQEVMSYDKLNWTDIEDKLTQEQKEYIDKYFDMTPIEFKMTFLDLLDLIGFKDTKIMSIEGYIDALEKEEILK